MPYKYIKVESLVKKFGSALFCRSTYRDRCTRIRILCVGWEMYSYDEANRTAYAHEKESGEIFTRCSHSVPTPIQPKPDAMQETREIFI